MPVKDPIRSIQEELEPAAMPETARKSRGRDRIWRRFFARSSHAASLLPETDDASEPEAECVGAP